MIDSKRTARNADEQQSQCEGATRGRNRQEGGEAQGQDRGAAQLKRAELRAAGQGLGAGGQECAQGRARARPTPSRHGARPDGGKFQYGALDFGRELKVTAERKVVPKPGSKMRRTQRALEQAEAHAALLARIKAGDATDAEKERAEATKWKAALARASGEKVHDDIRKLKKTIKHREKQKEKSTKPSGRCARKRWPTALRAARSCATSASRSARASRWSAQARPRPKAGAGQAGARQALVVWRRRRRRSRWLRGQATSRELKHTH
jgi:hypothetical protein